jgi:hypothetical protein
MQEVKIVPCSSDLNTWTQDKIKFPGCLLKLWIIGIWNPLYQFPSLLCTSIAKTKGIGHDQTVSKP